MMGLFDRIARVFQANVNDMIANSQIPEEVIDKFLLEMQNDLIQLRQAVAKSIIVRKKTEQQLQKNTTEANTWQQRAQLALTKGDENLAREALMRKKSFADHSTILQQQLLQQNEQVKVLQNNLIALELKIAELKTRKDMIKARIVAAQERQPLDNSVTNIDTTTTTPQGIERKVLEIEAIIEDSNNNEEREKLLKEKKTLNQKLHSIKDQLSKLNKEINSLETKLNEGTNLVNQIKLLHERNLQESQLWQKILDLANLQQEELLIKEASDRNTFFKDNAKIIKQQLDQIEANISPLKPQLAELQLKHHSLSIEKNSIESQITSIDSRIDRLKLQSSAMAAFKQMEEKLKEIESSSAIDDELEIMKRQLTGGTTPQGALHQGTSSPNTSSSPVDAELEELRRKIDGL